MHQFLEFVIRHWELWLLFVVLFGLLMVEEAKASNLKDGISTQETINRMNSQNAKIIDLRKSSEFTRCHIKGAISVPTVEMKKVASALEKWKNNPIVLVSSSGQALSHLVISLRKKGFENIATLAGGMKEWLKQELPTTQEESK